MNSLALYVRIKHCTPPHILFVSILQSWWFTSRLRPMYITSRPESRKSPISLGHQCSFLATQKWRCSPFGKTFQKNGNVGPVMVWLGVGAMFLFMDIDFRWISCLAGSKGISVVHVWKAGSRTAVVGEPLAMGNTSARLFQKRGQSLSRPLKMCKIKILKICVLTVEVCIFTDFLWTSWQLLSITFLVDL